MIHLTIAGGTATGYGFRAGLIFDTCVACDEVFSYRLKIGGGKSVLKVNDFWQKHARKGSAISDAAFAL